MKNNIILTTLAPNSHRTSEENLGLGYLKSSLEANGFNVIIIDGWLNNYTINEVYSLISKYSDVLFIGFSSYMTNTEPTIDLIKALKKDGHTILCGGFGPAFYPEEYLQHGADYVLCGEGETAIVDFAFSLLNCKSLENVRGLFYKENAKIKKNEPVILSNLDEYHFPARDTIDLVLEKKSTVNMVTSRGCTGNCEFCSVIAFFDNCKGKKWRTRSINNIVDEIEDLYINGVNHIKMVDDSFVDGIRDENWCAQFADEIEKRNIQIMMRGQIRADKISDSVLFHLKRAGFYSFACGIESGSPSALKRMNKTATVKDNEKALTILKKYNYLVQMGFILFDQETTLEELWENYYFLKKYIFAVTKGIFSEMYSATGTKLTQKLKNRNDLILGNFMDGNNSYELKDDAVKKIYHYLREWHKSHSYIYDMTIDPLSAPKTISQNSRNELLKVALKLKKLDLIFFKKVLESFGKTDDYINVDSLINNSSNAYEENYQIVKKVYEKEKLKYDGSINPFII